MQSKKIKLFKAKDCRFQKVNDLDLDKAAFTYDVRFLGTEQVGQAASDFIKKAYVLKYLIRAQVGRSKYPKII